VSDDPYGGLKAKLAAYQLWPGPYVFKFIVPQTQAPQLLQLFDGHDVQTRESRTGRYLSVTCHREMESSDAVVDVYRSASGIPGVISL